MLNTKRENRAFTLIELLVVVAIIGLLASVVIASLTSAESKGRDAKRKEDINSIETALELYYNDHGQYPPSGGATSPNSGWSNDSDSSWATLQSYLKPYLVTLSKDPSEDNNPNYWGYYGKHYSYFSLAYGCNQQWYMIVYRLENSSGPDNGVKTCDGTYFQYGGTGSSTNIKTVGTSR